MTGATSKDQSVNYRLLAVGIVLILLPLLFVVAFPDHVKNANFFLRLVASLGGALVGAALPGLLEITLPGIRAAGALAVLVMFWQFNPPEALHTAIEPTPVTVPTPGTHYESSTSHFEKRSGSWIEQQKGAILPLAHFRELYVNTQYIYLVDDSRIKDGEKGNALNVRIPINGGMVQWSWENPVQWTDLKVVSRR